MNNMELTAHLLPIISNVVPKISTMIYVEDQECVIAFFRDSSIKRIPTPGEGLEFMKQLLDGMEDEHGKG